MKSTIKQRIQDEFARRKLANNLYSLRAFSRDLGIHHSQLSRIFSSKRPITLKIFVKISEQLSLTTEEIQFYRNGIVQEKPNHIKKKVQVMPVRKLLIEEFKALQAWYHYAILELPKLDDFVASEEWISQRLNLTEAEAKMALERLRALNLVPKEGTAEVQEEMSL